VKQRLTRRIEGDEFTARAATRGTHFGDVSGAADCRHAVARSAACPVIRRAQSLVRSLDLEKVVQAKPEFLELYRRHAGERIAGYASGDLRDEQASHKDDRYRSRGPADTGSHSPRARHESLVTRLR
jgi:hypothetical protein